MTAVRDDEDRLESAGPQAFTSHPLVFPQTAESTECAKCADEEDEKQMSARQRGSAQQGLLSRIASAFNCELPTTLVSP